jgi:aspartyl-tRNA(Asn)/glutamyl-tRNA(Gln) amidotransferase subunit C
MVEIKDIEHLAALARIHISDEEKESFKNEIDSILEYVNQIQKISGETEPAREAGDVRNITREDGSPHESGLHTEALLREAPKREGQYVKVKKIL